MTGGVGVQGRRAKAERESLIEAREYWGSFKTIHRLWRESETTPSGQKRHFDHQYASFAHTIGKLAEEQLTEDLRRSLLARIDELTGAFTQAAVERLIDEAFTHDAMVKARREAEGV
jgi:hypothetical protein